MASFVRDSLPTLIAVMVAVLGAGSVSCTDSSSAATTEDGDQGGASDPSGEENRDAGGRTGAVDAGRATGSSADAGRTPTSGSDGGRAADGAIGASRSADAGASDASASADGSSEVDASTAEGSGPCDLYASGNTPCVAAHSTVRALYGSYGGKLYQVRRASDKTTKDVGTLSPGGVADSAVQDAFCAGTTCTISTIYDQSPKQNHLTSAPPGGNKRTPGKEANAAALKIMLAGHPVYAVSIETGMGYRNNKTSGIATGDQPEGEYMVTSGKRYNGGCCFDYGNAETSNNDDGNGTMEAVYFGNSTVWGKGSGSGPWVMADLENGLFAGTNGVNDNNTPLAHDYVTAAIKGKAKSFAIKGGNAQSGSLKTMYDGARPKSGYDPMKKQGAIILGIGGDNSNDAIGSFFEGCMTSGYPSDATDDAVQANIVAAGYGQ